MLGSPAATAAPSTADQFHFLGLGPFTSIRSAELDPTVLQIDPVFGLDIICCNAVGRKVVRAANMKVADMI